MGCQQLIRFPAYVLCLLRSPLTVAARYAEQGGEKQPMVAFGSPLTIATRHAEQGGEKQPMAAFALHIGVSFPVANRAVAVYTEAVFTFHTIKLNFQIIIQKPNLPVHNKYVSKEIQVISHQNGKFEESPPRKAILLYIKRPEPPQVALVFTKT